MDLGLENKVALVAGGSSGLGLAAARELALEGAHVAIGARDPDRLAAAERDLKEVARGRVHTTGVDITDGAAARRWVDEVAADFGALHIVLISGGGPPVGTASRFEPAEYRAAVDAVLLPAVELALAALPHLRAAGWGRLLFVASETASVPIAPLALSGVTRAAIVRFAQSLAAEVGRDGITVNVLAPGTTRTPPVERAAAKLAGDGDAEERLRAMGSHNALGRPARPEEFAAVAAFLAGERASYVTGGVHPVDGGAGVMGPELPHLTDVRKDTFT
ncbi:3-oxoacyl-[acyl-carrier protein] reductase [Streptosporangium becharense]|uniref:3-oxoacyl-[acyl-carrier protein] reductase n=1 Tax=Streptosporangium becharense TaxID=1816182 RepID=A0A7W9MJX6_9ACTN|nr:SDR family oxidoreductase [Streptosporangium becharense]MBB2915377.1 3-oxoacyl-[acyl-carrier protein] reductase [Streptosporangium becharense]MBB5823737.1 3-oxoacyl-[acyl-carrier protein] reductase [Streptosporangium becharense]